MLSPKAPDSPDRFVTDIFKEVAEKAKTKRTSRRKSRDRSSKRKSRDRSSRRKSRDRTDRRTSRDRSRSWCKRCQAAQSKSANASSSDRPAAKEIPAKARPATITPPAKATNTSPVKAAPRTANTTEAARQQREEQRRQPQQPKSPQGPPPPAAPGIRGSVGRTQAPQQPRTSQPQPQPAPEQPELDTTDMYTTLGVPRNATALQIKKAYRSLALLHHPDKNPGSERASANLRLLNEAYETLSNAPKRYEYDMWLQQKRKQDEEEAERHASPHWYQSAGTWWCHESLHTQIQVELQQQIVELLKKMEFQREEFDQTMAQLHEHRKQ